MKKQFSILILITGVGLLLSSCSNISKTSLTKRHYRSGYYVEFGHGSQTISITSSLTDKPKHQIFLPAITANPKEPISVNTKKNPMEKFNPDQKIFIIRKDIQRDDKKVNNSAPKLSTENTLTQVYGNSQAGEVRAEVNVNVPYVVIILCAIFIPPLGVGLMYGINSYFWIDLILTLLFFFPGMIFALVVVLM